MITAPDTELHKAYQHAQTGCVTVKRDALGYIWTHGRDRLDLMHRLSTNDLLDMSVHEVKSTVLTNPIGRTVDYLIILNLDNKSLIITSPEKSDVVSKWIMKYIFFQDDVTLQVSDEHLVQTGLYGPKAHEVVNKIAPGFSTLSHNQAATISDNTWIIRVPPPGGIGYEIVSDPTTTQDLLEMAKAAGAVNSPSSLYELLRIEAGLPGAGHEIDASNIPLEIGLRNAISFTKGCYTGQEIIARLDSRRKLAKTLVGLLSSDKIPIDGTLKAPDGSSGVVTSSTYSPNSGWVGLALVKPTVCGPGTTLSVTKDGFVGSASVSALPFKSHLPV
ncbi:MAG: hypothetical protein QF535_09870 [Anaerolineales bacterium]|nr:hypothetical protein [Anaerolineales bacterium]